MFPSDDLAVIGLHTMFEHHEGMKEESLKAFIHEHHIQFAVGIDTPSVDDKDPIPKTMRSYNMGGTPTFLLIDRQGRVRKHKMEHDLMLGAELMTLMHQETVTEETASSVDDAENQGSMCSIEEGCT